VIGGNGSLIKNGATTLTLSAANTYTGGTTINDGTLALGLGGSLAAAGDVTWATPAPLDISGAGGSQTIGALNGVGGTTLALGAIR
jgi:autotransporter-associated beta strand protein